MAFCPIWPPIEVCTTCTPSFFDHSLNSIADSTDNESSDDEQCAIICFLVPMDTVHYSYSFSQVLILHIYYKQPFKLVSLAVWVKQLWLSALHLLFGVKANMQFLGGRVCSGEG